MTTIARIVLGAAVLAASALVAACGGGNDSAAPQAGDPLSQVPASASQSAAGLVDYLGSLAPLDADSSEPASLDTFAPKTSDDTEPLPVER